jgi:hypothetical protein
MANVRLVNLRRTWSEHISSAPVDLSLRHPGHPQAIAETRTRGAVKRIVAGFAFTEAVDGEAWIERESCLRGGLRLAGSA